MDQLTSLLETLPLNRPPNQQLKELALSQSLIPDSQGLYPYDDGYQATYDFHFAAFLILRAVNHPDITSLSSEGTSVSYSYGEFSPWESMLAQSSPILQSQLGDHITPLGLEKGLPYRIVPMRSKDH